MLTMSIPETTWDCCLIHLCSCASNSANCADLYGLLGLGSTSQLNFIRGEYSALIKESPLPSPEKPLQPLLALLLIQKIQTLSYFGVVEATKIVKELKKLF